MRTLDALTADRQRERELFQELQPRVFQKLDELKRSIELRQANDTEAALTIVLSDRGKRLMDQIRTRCAGISDSAYLQLRDSTAEADRSANRTRLLSTGGSLLLLCLLSTAAVVIARATARREQMIQTVQFNERQTREARDLLQTTLSSIGDAVIATDEQARITFLNHVAETLTGWTHAEARGRPLDEVFRLIDEETRAEVKGPADEGLRLGEPSRSDDRTLLVTKAGRETPIDNTSALIRNEEKAVAGMVVVFRDVSERRASAKLKESANQALKRSNADLELFAYAASHDLQEPLRIVVSYAQLLHRRCKGKLDQEANDFIGYIVSGGKRMSQTIQDLLSYVESAEPVTNPAPVDCNQVLREVIDNCRMALKESGGSVGHQTLPVIFGEESRIAQLFQNLVTNGLKYCREGIAPEVRVSATQKEGDWLFAVADNGIGIEREYQEQIFVLSQRLHKRKFSGTGIGLALCKRIVEGYGGKIWVDSEAGSGSTFYFTLPKSTMQDIART